MHCVSMLKFCTEETVLARFSVPLCLSSAAYLSKMKVELSLFIISTLDGIVHAITCEKCQARRLNYSES